MKQRINITAIIRDKKGHILSTGKNSYIKTHPMMYRYGRHIMKKAIFLHAEIHAIVKCKQLDKAYSIEIYRTFANGEVVLIKPCEICAGAIKDNGLKLIY